MPFLIPLAGLALGALGRLISNRRSQNALNKASGSGFLESTTSETSTSMSDSALEDTRVEDRQTEGKFVRPKAEETPQATEPATGPVQQNQGDDSPTPSTEGEAPPDAGLAARLGRESAAASRKKNRTQQSTVSNAALR